MAEISALLVKQLRERTGAGMMECKKALVEANGDLPEAEVVLRKRGIASASKKESRSAKQGLISAFINTDSKVGVLVEVNCESDFVARTDEFQALAAGVAEHIAATKPKAVKLEELAEVERANIKAHETLYEQKFSGAADGATVSEFVRTKIAKLGENINISRFVIYEAAANGFIGHYIHAGAQIGVLLEIATAAGAGHDEFKTLVRDIAMQVAAAHPLFVGKEQVPAALVARERDIQRDRALNEGKPEKMVDKIAEGRMSKFYEEVCLLEQPFIRENTISIAELIKTTGAKIGGAISIVRFERYKVGDFGDAPGVQESPLPVSA
jgi:elongation factor Ts